MVDHTSSDVSERAGTRPVFSKGRDLDAARVSLDPWLSDRLGAAAVIRRFTYPTGAGVSNETLLLEIDVAGRDAPVECVVRVHPSPDFQLFLDPEFRLQYDVLEALHRDGRVPVAQPYWFEDDPDVLGRPFFVMEQLHGEVPVSMPVYNATGWLHDADPSSRRTLWESAVHGLAQIHLVPFDEVSFVDRPAWGATGVEQQLDYWDRCLSWSLDGRVPDIMHTFRRWLGDHLPDRLDQGLSWGDARMGNMMFGRDFRLVGVNDWEQASSGGPMQDLGWWLFFDDYHSVDHGVDRLDGLGGRQETIDLWETITGLMAHDVHWYEVFAGYKLSTLLLRTVHLGTLAGRLSEPPPMQFIRRTCRLLDIEIPEEYR